MKSKKMETKNIKSDRMKANLSVSKKHYQQDGKWVVKPIKTVIILCTCGNKYIKTREEQIVCVRCLVRISGRSR